MPLWMTQSICHCKGHVSPVALVLCLPAGTLSAYVCIPESLPVLSFIISFKVYQVSLGWSYFLHSSLYSAVFQIGDQNSVGKTPGFQLLLNSPYRGSGPLRFLVVHPSREAGGGRSLVGDRAGTTDPNWPKRYCVPHNGTLSDKTGVGVYPKIAQGLAGHQSAGSERLIQHHLWVGVFCRRWGFFFPYSFIKQSLSRPTNFLTLRF